MSLIKPQRLRKGDTVAIVSPSWGGPSCFPHIYENGLREIEHIGLRIKEYPTARAQDSWLRTHPEKRADDINRAFKDSEVKAIIASIGGDDSVRVLPFLDESLIRKHPKILLGFSDTTTILNYASQCGIVTYHGPSVMAGFSQMGNYPRARDHLKEILFENPASYQYEPFAQYSEGYPDWSKEFNTGKVNKKRKAQEWHWLQGSSRVQGKLFGGCVEVLEFMKGTRYWPEPSFWDNTLLVLETSEEKPSPRNVKYMLRNYGVQGVFDRVGAVLFGRARNYSAQEKSELEKVLLQVIRDEFQRPALPIVTNLDFGHTDPQWVLPLGVRAELDCSRKRLRLLESPCKD